MDGSSSLLTLTDLSASDLTDLRLAAQIMAHRAALADRPRVAMYFESLEAAVMAEQAARGQARQADVGLDGAAISDESAGSARLLDGAMGTEDRRLIAEYLGLLADNGRLPPAIRKLCRSLMVTNPA
jgi:hypothetical protein